VVCALFFAKMVELSDPKGPVKEGIDNTIFIVPGIIIFLLVSFCVYKLVKSLREKGKAQDEKKKLKQQRQEKKLKAK